MSAASPRLEMRHGPQDVLEGDGDLTLGDIRIRAEVREMAESLGH